MKKDPHKTKERSHPTASRFVDKPDSVIFVHKRKGWGSVSNVESQKMSQAGADRLITLFPAKTFSRYKVNIFYKTDHSA